MDPWYWPVTYLCDGSEQSPVYCFSHALFVYELQQHSLRKGMHKSALFSTLKKRDMVSLSNGINDCSNIHWHKWLFKYTWMTVRQTLQKWLRPYAQRCEHMRTQHCKCILEARHNKKAHIHTVSLGSGLQHTHIYTHTHTHTHTHHFIYS